MERAIVATVLGLPGYAAIGIAFGFTGLGVFIDLERINGLGTVFKACYFLGCVLSVCWVKRRALFGPMVQPPLLLAIAVPGVVLASGGAGPNGGKAAKLLAIATPLLNGFPTMAATTLIVLLIGIGRYRVQRPDPTPERVRAGGIRPEPESLPVGATSGTGATGSTKRSRPVPPLPSDDPDRPPLPRDGSATPDDEATALLPRPEAIDRPK
jgi:hypothetical protein